MPFAKAAIDIATENTARFVLALVLIVGTFVLLVLQREVPTVLWAMDASAIGYFVGGASERSRTV